MILLRTASKQVSNTKKEQCAMLPEFLSFLNDVKSSTKVGISKNKKKVKCK